MSQKVTLKDRYLPRIKQLLLEQKNQKEISLELGLCRETVNRKMQVWIQTDDFTLWLKQAWIDKYQKVDDLEAFRALTQLLGKTLTRKIEEQIEISEQVVTVNVTENEDEILSKATSILSRKDRFNKIH